MALRAGPRWPPEGSREAQEGPRLLKIPPRPPQDPPKIPPRSPTKAPRVPRTPKNIEKTLIFSMFFGFGFNGHEHV